MLRQSVAVVAVVVVVGAVDRGCCGGTRRGVVVAVVMAVAVAVVHSVGVVVISTPAAWSHTAVTRDAAESGLRPCRLPAACRPSTLAQRHNSGQGTAPYSSRCELGEGGLQNRLEGPDPGLSARGKTAHRNEPPRGGSLLHVQDMGKTQDHKSIIEQQWRLAAVAGWWRLAVGGWWRLVFGGGGRLAVVGGWWRLAVGGWRLVFGGGWQLVVPRGCP